MVTNRLMEIDATVIYPAPTYARWNNLNIFYTVIYNSITLYSPTSCVPAYVHSGPQEALQLHGETNSVGTGHAGACMHWTLHHFYAWLINAPIVNFDTILDLQPRVCAPQI